MKLKERILRWAARGDRKLLTKLLCEEMSFVTDLNYDRFEQNSMDIWSTVSFNVRPLREWIKERKTLIMRQNMIEGQDHNGLLTLLGEYETIEQYMGSPVAMHEYPVALPTGAELKTKEEIMKAYKERK